MAFAFDTLACARKLRSAGIPQDQAEAHAAREFIMAELVTKTDLQNAVESVRRDIDTLALRLTVRTGAMIGAGIAIIAGAQRLLTN